MDTITALTDLLKSGGPYAVTAIALFVAAFMYKEREKLRRDNAEEFKKLRADNKDLQEKIIDMVTRLTEVVTQNNTTNEQLVRLIERWDRQVSGR